MMPLLRAFALLAATVALALAPAADTAAQRVWVDVGPYGGVRVRTPWYSYDGPPGPSYWGPPPVYYPGYVGPGYIGPPRGGRVEVRVGRPTFRTRQEPAGARPWPAEMTREQLLSELESAHSELHARLARFSGGEGWQRYFALPESAGDYDSAYLQLLPRFESVAANPEYRVIAELEEFAAMRELLHALDARHGGRAPEAMSDDASMDNDAMNQGGAPDRVDSSAETLPAPQPRARADAEQSVLVIPEL